MFFCLSLLCQQSTETVPAVQMQEAELAESLRAEFHETACKIQSLQVETESLKTMVRDQASLSGKNNWPGSHIILCENVFGFDLEC